MAGDDLAKLVLYLIAGAFFVNVLKGTGWQWLHAKFIGAPATSRGPSVPSVLSVPSRVTGSYAVP